MKVGDKIIKITNKSAENLTEIMAKYWFLADLSLKNESFYFSNISDNVF